MAVLLGGAGAATAASGQADGNFAATATADAMRVTVTVPGGVLVDQVTDDGATTAQAVLTSLGESTAFASSVYPGEVVLSLLGVARGSAPVPEYPLIAMSSHPTRPADRQENAAQSLEAVSGQSSSSANAAAGQSPAGNRLVRSQSAASATRRPDGTVTATAASRVDGLVIGPMTIGAAESRSTATRDKDGKLRREATFTLTGVSVAGQAVTIDAKGVRAAGTTVPLADTSAARQALEQAGVTVVYLEPTEVDEGVISAGLAVTAQVPVSLTGTGTSDVTFVLGRTIAMADAAADDGEQEAAPVVQTPPDSGDTGAAGADQSRAAEVALPAELGSGSPVEGASSVVVPPQVGPEPQAAAAELPVVASAAAPVRAELYYLGFLLAGLALSAGSVLFRYIGVRQPWIS